MSPRRIAASRSGGGFFRYIGVMEQKFIRWLEDNFADVARAEDGFKNVLLGIGDDGAVLSGSTDKQVVVSDAIVDQVHFDLAVHSLSRVGHKALAVNLSDIAAMGAEAESAVVSLVLPRSFTFEQTKQLFTGIATTAGNYGVSIIGGDTCCHDGPLMVSITATGRIPAESKIPGGWRMDGAKAGDVVIVSGPLGGSIDGKHLDFEPRLQLARDIQHRVPVSAATDISDSLSIDLSHVLRKSKIGAVLDLSEIPVAKAANNDVARALNDGEDFELLFFMPRESYKLLTDDSSFEHGLTAIGEVTAEFPGEIRDLESGEKIEPAGYEHR